MFWQWLQHAFAIEPPGPAVPTPAQEPVVERVCREVVRRGFTVPALMFLESAKPLNFVGAQALEFFSPFVALTTGSTEQTQLAAFLERRGAIDHLCRRIEELDQLDEPA